MTALRPIAKLVSGHSDEEMHGKTRLALLGYGLSTTLIDKVAQRNHTIGALRELNRAALLAEYEPAEVDEIKAKLERTPIPDETLDALLSKCDGACSYCADGNNVRPFQVHHIVPYSRTQDNADENLLVVCPTHHVSIHENRITFESQKSQRRRWEALVELASQFRKKGLQFPFGFFQSPDYKTPVNPAELVQLGPLSPSTTLTCYPPELSTRAEASFERAPFLVVFGGSGSGKSTFATAIAGLQQRREFRPYRHRFEKKSEDTLKQVFFLLSVAVRPVFLILDDANTWATAADLEELWRAVCNQTLVRVLLTWADDDSRDTGKLRACPVPKLQLSWTDLKPAVVAALLANEADVVRELQHHEPDRSIGSLGLGSLHSSLSNRIRALGEQPHSVYEFIFGLRGDVRALDEELTALANDHRSDLPVLYAAVEQIADFERPVSIEETVAACHRVEGNIQLPAASPAWVARVFERAVRNRRIVRVRDSFTTIHRKWAARLIAAALASKPLAPNVEELLRPSFDVASANPERLLRLWSWLRSIDESRPFTRNWAASLQQENWNLLEKRCAESGLVALGGLASLTHLLFNGDKWTTTLRVAFEANLETISAAVYAASEQDWYSLRELAMAMGHAAPDMLVTIVRAWDPNRVAANLLKSRPEHFQSISWLLSSIRKVDSEWLSKLGDQLPWDQYAGILELGETGDVESLAECFGVYRSLRGNLRRSMLRTFAGCIKAALTNASIGDLRLSPVDTDIMILASYFPDDARAALEAVDAVKFGAQLNSSLPRDWRELLELSMWASHCGSELPARIISACDILLVERQAYRFAREDRYEFRLLLHFLRHGPDVLHHAIAEDLRDLVRAVCAPKDSEAKSIITAYRRLDVPIADSVAEEVGIEPEEYKDAVNFDSFEGSRQKFRERDKLGEDYDIEL